jgi:Ni/Co efflux regulator RcnB
MKRSSIACAFAALSLSLGSLGAFAQAENNADYSSTNRNNNPVVLGQQGVFQFQGNPPNNPNVDRRDGGRRDVDRNQRTYDRSYDRNNNPRNYDRRDYERRADRDQQRFYYGARSPEFRRGGYIPYEYRSRQYYVNDWRGHHLSAPPRGYQWVQVGSDYVLIALATGLIANLILNQ